MQTQPEPEAEYDTLALLKARNAELERKLQQQEQELQQTREALQEVRKWLQIALDASGIAVWEHDLRTNTSTISNRAYGLYGIEPGSLEVEKSLFHWTYLGEQETAFNWVYPDELLFEWIHPEDRELVRQADEEALKTGSFKAEYRSLHPNGEVHWIFSLGNLVYDQAGQPAGLYGVELDITKRKMAELALRDSEEKFRQLAEAIQDVVWLRSADDQLLYVSPSYERIWGRSLENLYQHPNAWSEAIHLDDRDRILAAIQQTCTQYDVEYRIVRSDGEIRWIHDRAFAIWNEQGSPYRLAGIAKDITQRKQAEAQLRRALLQEKEVLLREVHHRVKNNLQVISSLLNLQIHSTQDSKLLSTLREIQSRVQAMALIHDQLYQLPNLARINFADYTRDLAEHILRSYSTHTSNICLNCNIAEVELTINTAIPCSLIINELVINALKHAFPDHRSGEIRIDFASNERGQHVLIIRDNGIGMPDRANASCQ